MTYWGFGDVAHDVQLAQPLKLGGQLAAALGVLAGVLAGLRVDRVEHEPAKLGVGLEGVQPVDQLLLQRLRGEHRLLAGAVVAAGGALVAAHPLPAAAAAVHPRAAVLAVDELAQQVLLGGPAGLDDLRAPRADLLHPVEQLVGDDRLVQPADRSALVPQPADVPGVGGVAQHLAHGVLAEQAAAGGAGALGVQPCREGAVGLVAGRVALEQLEHERRALGVRARRAWSAGSRT